MGQLSIQDSKMSSDIYFMSWKYKIDITVDIGDWLVKVINDNNFVRASCLPIGLQRIQKREAIAKTF